MLLEVKLDELVGGDVLAGVTSSAAVCVRRGFFHTNLSHVRSYVKLFVGGTPLSLLSLSAKSYPFLKGRREPEENRKGPVKFRGQTADNAAMEKLCAHLRKRSHFHVSTRSSLFSEPAPASRTV